MAVENFNLYTEVDESGDIARTATRVVVTTMATPDTSYVYFDKGVAHFGDFEHLLTVRLTACAVYGHCCFWALTNGAMVISDMVADDDGISLRFYRHVTNGYFLYLQDFTNDNYDSYVPAAATTYYLTVKRAGTALTCKIYDNILRRVGDLLDTLTIVCTNGPLRYILPCANRETAAVGVGISYYTENLDLQEVPAGHPHSFGVVF